MLGLRIFSFADNYFTAPVRGLYWFGLNIFTSNGRAIIEVNGQTVTAAAHFDADGSTSGDASTVILMLEAGDRVTCLKSSTYTLEEHSTEYVENVFAGFLYAQL